MLVERQPTNCTHVPIEGDEPVKGAPESESLDRQHDHLETTGLVAHLVNKHLSRNPYNASSIVRRRLTTRRVHRRSALVKRRRVDAFNHPTGAHADNTLRDRRETDRHFVSP